MQQLGSGEEPYDPEAEELVMLLMVGVGGGRPIMGADVAQIELTGQGLLQLTGRWEEAEV